MYTISKRFDFSAGHHLNGLADDHPCTKRHGHNYQIITVLQKEQLDEVGFVKDYRALQPVKDYINRVLDHRYLNDVLPFNPTAENIARHLFYKFDTIIGGKLLKKVIVKETEKTEASYEPDHS